MNIRKRIKEFSIIYWLFILSLSNLCLISIGLSTSKIGIIREETVIIVLLSCLAFVLVSIIVRVGNQTANISEFLQPLFIYKYEIGTCPKEKSGEICKNIHYVEITKIEYEELWKKINLENVDLFSYDKYDNMGHYTNKIQSDYENKRI